MRVVYVSPLRALAVDIEKNLRSPLRGIALAAERLGSPFVEPTVGVRTGVAAVLRQTEGNLSLFTEQYKAGRRSLLELVGQYDAYARLERDQVSISYDVALLELQIARDRGVLVDGANL